MNTPNKITVGRIILVPVFMVLLYLDLPYWALAVYIIACVGDLIDGRIARKYNLVTDFGKFMDPLADKMLVLSAMCYFVEYGQMPGWCLAIVLLHSHNRDTALVPRSAGRCGHMLGADPCHNAVFRHRIFRKKHQCVQALRLT